MTKKDIRELLIDKSVPAVLLVSAGAGRAFSKLGGLPEVPPQFDWPMWKGSPAAFIAQIDLAELPPSHGLEGLPQNGRLYFFYDQEQSTWGFDPEDKGSWRVIYVPASVDLVNAEAPAGLGKDYVYREKRWAPKTIQSIPSVERLGEDVPAEFDMAYEIVEELRSAYAAEGPEHQLGGFPNPIQGDSMELESQLASNGLYCGDPSGYSDPRAVDLAPGASEWKLLLQVDSDDDTNMMWGDCGRLYFWIRGSDLAAGDFSKVWMILQCG
ncbi:MAG: YwqG family protein [Pseudomonadota bacterium]